MKNLSLITILSLVCIFLQAQAFGDFVFTQATLLPVDSETPPYVANVYVSQGKISSIVIGESTPKNGYQEISAKGKFLLPGITEMHAHIPVPTDGDDTYVKETLFLYASQGVTTIRGMLGNPYHLELKNLVRNREIFGPRIFTSSPSCNGNTIPSVEVAREKVKQYAEEGYDFLKLHPGLTLEVFNEIVRVAEEANITYAGHVSAEVGIERAIKAHYASIDHLDGYMEGLVPEVQRVNTGFFGLNVANKVDRSQIAHLAEMTREHDVAVVPTQTLFTRWASPEDPQGMMQQPEMKYMPAKTRYSWLQNKTSLLANNYDADRHAYFLETRILLIRALRDAGVTFLLGSDAPQVMNVPGFSLHHEMETMQQAGLTPQEILKSGTVNPAAFFGQSEIFGTIAEGKSADLILLNANPLEDIRHMRKIVGVMVAGQWLDRTMIDSKLAQIADRHQE